MFNQVQSLLTNFSTYVFSQESTNSTIKNSQPYKAELTERVQEILNRMGEVKVQNELKGQFIVVYSQLLLLKSHCATEGVTEKLSKEIDNINSYVQFYFNTTTFDFLERYTIRNYPNLVIILRAGQEGMLMGHYGTHVQKMLIDGDSGVFICIPRFALVNLLDAANGEMLGKLKQEGVRLINENGDTDTATKAEEFKQLCNDLKHLCEKGAWQQLDDNLKTVIYKRFAEQELEADELKRIQENPDCSKLVQVIFAISEILVSRGRSSYSAIIKAGLVSWENMIRALITPPVSNPTQVTQPPDSPTTLNSGFDSDTNTITGTNIPQSRYPFDAQGMYVPPTSWDTTSDDDDLYNPPGSSTTFYPTTDTYLSRLVGSNRIESGSETEEGNETQNTSLVSLANRVPIANFNFGVVPSLSAVIPLIFDQLLANFDAQRIANLNEEAIRRLNLPPMWNVRSLTTESEYATTTQVEEVGDDEDNSPDLPPEFEPSDGDEPEQP